MSRPFSISTLLCTTMHKSWPKMLRFVPARCMLAGYHCAPFDWSLALVPRTHGSWSPVTKDCGRERMGKLRFMGPMLLGLLMALGCGDDDGNGNGTDAGSPVDSGRPGVDGGGPGTDGGGPMPMDGGIDAGSSMHSCPAGACDLITNAGCGAGEACKLVVTAEGMPPSPNCIPAGAAGDGETCSAGGDCQEGLHCQDGTCRAYCCSESRTGCPTGQSCLTNLVDQMGNATGVGLCGVPSGCDLLAQDCPMGEGCYPTGDAGDCVRPTGVNAMQGGSCTATNDCAPGFACINATTGGGDTCAAFCNREGGDPACPMGFRCNGVTGFPDIVGVCIADMSMM